ncbi:hypothetical protein SAMN05444354_12357 [Stigmatella aurantiaca]|uniref:TIGR01777 family protein n=1 Tax=Stigmatella aurantiaca TaxID=41 RepID=A0A1H8BCI2_STIAU|nr:TIGR01777 family oxidoreductase [Stigmatella aurantiaca]SEM79557.1 hypothetical protein SAMN05444354_12357 [Stigmatella aurantiaca]
MKVAITGANGFLGTALVQGLLEHGHTVHVLVRNVEQSLARLPPGVTGAPFHAEAPLPPEALAGAEAVVYLAGASLLQRWNEESKQRIRNSRTQGTHHLVEALRAAGTVKRFVCGSAVGHYGTGLSSATLTEDSPPGDDFLAQVCVEWEAQALRAREAGISTALARIGMVLHPEGGALHALLPQFRLGAGGRVGSGKQYVSWVHRADQVAALRFLLEHPELEGPYNIAAPEPVTNAEFAHTLAHVLGRPSVMTIPAFVLKAAVGEGAVLMLHGQRVLPQRLTEAGFSFRHPRLEGALKDLLA